MFNGQSNTEYLFLYYFNGRNCSHNITDTRDGTPIMYLATMLQFMTK